ncbi:hypothetical protein Rhal01_03419 [Rubritalea halochordaticola]|uniref:Uncharacterized protein n=1 Tax=Rubritalea halochordaticola TaxID=714537 RepID=A0ABP9V850_9BACT
MKILCILMIQLALMAGCYAEPGEGDAEKSDTLTASQVTALLKSKDFSAKMLIEKYPNPAGLIDFGRPIGIAFAYSGYADAAYLFVVELKDEGASGLSPDSYVITQVRLHLKGFESSEVFILWEKEKDSKKNEKK